jgi:hypothetical protein
MVSDRQKENKGSGKIPIAIHGSKWNHGGTKQPPIRYIHVFFSLILVCCVFVLFCVVVNLIFFVYCAVALGM